MKTGTEKICIVCGGNVDENISSAYGGVIYYFSSHECKELFDKNPEEYVL